MSEDSKTPFLRALALVWVLWRDILITGPDGKRIGHACPIGWAPSERAARELAITLAELYDPDEIIVGTADPDWREELVAVLRGEDYQRGELPQNAGPWCPACNVNGLRRAAVWLASSPDDVPTKRRAYYRFRPSRTGTLRQLRRILTGTSVEAIVADTGKREARLARRARNREAFAHARDELATGRLTGYVDGDELADFGELRKHGAPRAPIARADLYRQVRDAADLAELVEAGRSFAFLRSRVEVVSIEADGMWVYELDRGQPYSVFISLAELAKLYVIPRTEPSLVGCVTRKLVHGDSAEYTYLGHGGSLRFQVTASWTNGTTAAPDDIEITGEEDPNRKPYDARIWTVRDEKMLAHADFVRPDELVTVRVRNCSGGNLTVWASWVVS